MSERWQLAGGHRKSLRVLTATQLHLLKKNVLRAYTSLIRLSMHDNILYWNVMYNIRVFSFLFHYIIVSWLCKRVFYIFYKDNNNIIILSFTHKILYTIILRPDIYFTGTNIAQTASCRRVLLCKTPTAGERKPKRKRTWRWHPPR